MAKFVWFFTAIFAIICGSSTLVVSSVEVMSQYARVENDLFSSIYISLVGDKFSSSFGQCASACNLHGGDCHGYVFQTSSCNGKMPTNVGHCQLVALVSQAGVAIIYTSTSCQQLYINIDWLTSVKTSPLLTTASTTSPSMQTTGQLTQEGANCSYPFTYNSQLFYNCTTNVTDTSSTNPSYFCFASNRSVVVCPATNFTAHYEYINLTAATEPSMSTLSVFGWIIFQQRTPVSPSFNWKRKWTEYKNGFGSIGSNFWLGLERVHQLTSSTKYRLRIELQMNSTGRWYSVEYWSFVIGDEQVTKYQLNVDGYSGDGDDGLRCENPGSRWYHNGMPFSTIDVNNVPTAWTDCASTYSGGWWFNGCYCVCLTCADAFTEWYTVPDTSDYWLSTTRMMIKPQ